MDRQMDKMTDRVTHRLKVTQFYKNKTDRLKEGQAERLNRK